MKAKFFGNKRNLAKPKKKENKNRYLANENFRIYFAFTIIFFLFYLIFQIGGIGASFACHTNDLNAMLLFVIAYISKNLSFLFLILSIEKARGIGILEKLAEQNNKIESLENEIKSLKSKIE